MAELKHGFSQAKMNKDLDERLVPEGQYRDALNIQIATSDDSNIGSAQTLLGNSVKNKMSDLFLAADSRASQASNAVYDIPTTAVCVGSIALPEKDKIYYMVAAGKNVSETATVTYGVPNMLDIAKDYILEYDVVTKGIKYVFVDIYRVAEDLAAASTQLDDFIYIPNLSSATVNKTGVRIGMTVEGTLDGVEILREDGVTVSNIEYNFTVGAWKIYLDKKGSKFTSFSASQGDSVVFNAPRVLNFDFNRKITGINVLDDMLFWTDNFSEPKKINIKRSKAGTGGVEYLHTGKAAPTTATPLLSGQTAHANLGWSTIDTTKTNKIFDGDTPYFHTRLVIDKKNDGKLNVVTNAAGNRVVDVEEKHITVIRKASTQPLELDMSRDVLARKLKHDLVQGSTTLSAGTTIDTFTDTLSGVRAVDGSYTSLTSGASWVNAVGNLLVAGDEIKFKFSNPYGMPYFVGDVLLFTAKTSSTAAPLGGWADEDIQIRVIVTESDVKTINHINPNHQFTGLILSIDTEVTSTTGNSGASGNAPKFWYCKLKKSEPLFEFKLVRFSYRYKYADGEYSPFAPFSQVAFLPDQYEYHPIKGFNLGMRNQLRGLKLKYYFYDPKTIPDDVVEIDILYKEANNAAVYTVKTIKPTDGHPIWPDLNVDSSARGELEIKTDLVHALVPSNQILRPWDNVPRVALGQEITANRLVYGNYLQSYTVRKDPEIEIQLKQNLLTNASEAVWGENIHPMPSVKSMRTYHVGVVFSDDYGRETPVLTNKDATITVPRGAATTRNRIFVKLGENTEIPSWAKYLSYYIKETSSEYYTMAMDRWYNSSDGNIWLAFPSSERNKVDEETFLILKKAHHVNTPVTGGADNLQARYKILAIENEAPDYIKTEKKNLGNFIDVNKDKVGNSTEGYPLEGSKFVDIEQGAFSAVFGEDLPTITPDSLYVRFHGPGGDVSEEYEVSNCGKDSSNNSVRLTFKRPLGNDIAFASTNGSYSGRINNLQIELTEHEIENRPEFDGRFFVKIYKDQTLDNYVLNSAQQTSGLITVDTERLCYINNNYTGASAGNQTLGFNSTQQTGKDGQSHPTQYSHHDAYKWGDATLASGATSGTGNTWGLPSGDIASDSVVALNSKGTKSKMFWEGIANQGYFFIDAASAYSLTSGDGDQPGQYLATKNYMSNDSNAFDEPLGADPTGGTETSNTKDEKGQPSRGIWGTNNQYMDIAWSGMGMGYTGQATTFPHKLNEIALVRHQEAWKFVNTLVEPGTQFRFQRDPDKIVYTVESFDYNATHNPFVGSDPFNIISKKTGVWGIRNYSTDFANVNKDWKQYQGANMRQRWTIKVTPGIGTSGPSQYNPVTGTAVSAATSKAALHHDAKDFDVIEIVVPYSQLDPTSDNFTENPAIWETEPKENFDLDIYYQASGLIPLLLTEETNEEYLPIDTTFKSTNTSGTQTTHTITSFTNDTITFTPVLPSSTTISDKQDIYFTKRNYYSVAGKADGAVTAGASTLKLYGAQTTGFWWLKLFRRYHVLDWNNCWCFGNGVESDRIRDDFNAPQMDNGVKASTVLAEPVREERRKHGLIYSGIYNSTSGVNDTNQFIAAESITKDLNPVHGSIQKLYARDSDLITLCEDKVLQILSKKDLLFNADGNSNVTATSKVLGAATAFPGDYGISKNPESFSAGPAALYFADRMRGKVLQLVGSKITPISDLGMKDYFSDNLKTYVSSITGTYDKRKNEYNVTIGKRYGQYDLLETYTTISYSASINGWTSFKSFHPESGVSINNNYYTFKNGQLYIHHDDTSITTPATIIGTPGTATTINVNNTDGLKTGMVVSGTGITDGTTISTISGSTVTLNNSVTNKFKSQDLTFEIPRNNFYGTQYDSDITLVFNDNPAVVKSFNAVNYEGTKAKVTAFTQETVTDAAGNTLTDINDNEYFNLTAKRGWYVDSIITNKQTGDVIEFKEKEGKWFGTVAGDSTVGSGSGYNIDEAEFSVQGLGVATFEHSSPVTDEEPPTETRVLIRVANKTGVSNWDATADNS